MKPSRDKPLEFSGCKAPGAESLLLLLFWKEDEEAVGFLKENLFPEEFIELDATAAEEELVVEKFVLRLVAIA